MNTKLTASKTNQKIIFILFISLYFLYNSLHLLDFFYVHSDETWLIGLSKAMFENKTFKLTEPFFDLYPRTVHALRLVYVSLLGLFIQFFKSSIYAGRMLSLISGVLTLFFLKRWLSKKKLFFSFQMIVIAFVALNIQFLMTIHSARQESLILLAMILCLNFYDHKHSPFILSFITGICISIHPNSFLIFLGILALMIYDGFKKKTNLKSILIYFFGVSLWAIFFISLSLLLNKNFIHEYLNYGRSLGVVDSNITRTQGFYYFYYKIYHQISGTYFIVNNRVILIVSSLAYLSGFLLLFVKKDLPDLIRHPFFMVTGINIGLLIIGRYNQTSIIFPLFFFVLLMMGIFNYLITAYPKASFLKIVLLIFLVFQLFITRDHIISYAFDTEDYLSNQLDVIPKEAIILGNINLLTYLEDHEFYDYRNLWHLSGDEALKYISDRHIEYIIWPEEMSYIYPQERWHILYGPMAYYPDLKDFLDNQTLLTTFESKTYGMRISRYVNTYPWKIQIYKVHSY